MSAGTTHYMRRGASTSHQPTQTARATHSTSTGTQGCELALGLQWMPLEVAPALSTVALMKCPHTTRPPLEPPEKSASAGGGPAHGSSIWSPPPPEMRP